MRKISKKSIIVFFILVAISLSLSFLTLSFSIFKIPLGNFRGVITIFSALFLFYIYSILVYRIFLYFYPLKEGEIEEGTREEFCHNVYALFYLMLFRSIICTRVIPTPIMRIIYLSLGSKLGVNTYCTGVILDPPLTLIGKNSLIGQDALLYSHSIERTFLSYRTINIGDNVTVGAKSIIMSGVTIGNNSIIAAGSVVKKGSSIGQNELWGGVPAKFIKKLD